MDGGLEKSTLLPADPNRHLVWCFQEGSNLTNTLYSCFLQKCLDYNVRSSLGRHNPRWSATPITHKHGSPQSSTGLQAESSDRWKT